MTLRYGEPKLPKKMEKEGRHSSDLRAAHSLVAEQSRTPHPIQARARDRFAMSSCHACTPPSAYLSRAHQRTNIPDRFYFLFIIFSCALPKYSRATGVAGNFVLPTPGLQARASHAPAAHRWRDRMQSDKVRTKRVGIMAGPEVFGAGGRAEIVDSDRCGCSTVK